MKRTLFTLLALFCFFSVHANYSDVQELKYSRQLLVLTTSSWNSASGELQRYDRRNDNENWKPIGKPIAVVVGQHGLAWAMPGSAPFPEKKEGDLRTPAGVFPIGSAFGFGPGYILKLKMPYTFINNGTLCVNDSQSRYYNRIINSEKIPHPDWKSAQNIRQSAQNMWGAIIDYNTHYPQAERGSCTFMHIWQNANRGTSGSVAMAEPEVEKLLTWLNAREKPMIAILPKSEYAMLADMWNIPRVEVKN